MSHDSDSESSEDSDDEDAEEEKSKKETPVLHSVSIAHYGGINRIRVRLFYKRKHSILCI